MGDGRGISSLRLCLSLVYPSPPSAFASRPPPKGGYANIVDFTNAEQAPAKNEQKPPEEMYGTPPAPVGASAEGGTAHHTASSSQSRKKWGTYRGKEGQEREGRIEWIGRVGRIGKTGDSREYGCWLIGCFFTCRMPANPRQSRKCRFPPFWRVLARSTPLPA